MDECERVVYGFGGIATVCESKISVYVRVKKGIGNHIESHLMLCL